MRDADTPTTSNRVLKDALWYAAAAAAVMPAAASAQIVYTDIEPDAMVMDTDDGDIAAGFAIDFDQDGDNEILFREIIGTSYGLTNGQADDGADNISGVVGNLQFGYTYFVPLAADAVIGPAQVIPTTRIFQSFTYAGSDPNGWQGTDAYIGLEFTLDSGNVHYGWVHIVYSAAGGSYQVTEYAFESTPNTPILAGATDGEPPPSPVELAMFDGNTTDGPTFTRPLSVGDGTSGSCSLSGTGVDVNYETHTLATDTDGDYIISITGEFDTYLLLYEGAFDPVDVCVDLIALDDDEGVVSTSTVGAGSYLGRAPLALDDAESYTIVVTAFSPTEFGAYNGSVFGPEDAEVTIDGGTPPPPGDPNPDFAAISLDGTTVPSSGGQLRFKYQLDNSAGSDGTPAEVDIWATVTSADGTTTLLPGQPRMVTVEDGEVVRNGYNQRVIESIPDGTYTYTLLAGDYETLTAYDMEEFTVTKGTPEFAGSLDAYKRSAEASGMKMVSPFEVPAPIAEQWQDASFDEVAPAVISNPTATNRAAKMTPSGQTNEVMSATVAPNPVSGAATVQFALKQSSDVTLSVYDALGRQVAQLVSGNMEAGDHRVSFDAASVPAGIYIFRLAVEGAVQTRRFTVVR